MTVVRGIGVTNKKLAGTDYLQRYRTHYSAVLWVEAGSRESIDRDYFQIYTSLYSLHLEAVQDTMQMRNTVPTIK